MFQVAKSETNNGEDACVGCELLSTKGKTVYPQGRCVGENCCSWFVQAAGENREAKEYNACLGISAEDAKDAAKLEDKKTSPLCPYFRSKPKPETKSVEVETEIADPAEVEKLVDIIADIVFWEDAESKTDWTLYPFEYRMLYGIWREAEKQIQRIQNIRMQMFIKSFGG